LTPPETPRNATPRVRADRLTGLSSVDRGVDLRGYGAIGANPVVLFLAAISNRRPRRSLPASHTLSDRRPRQAASPAPPPCRHCRRGPPPRPHPPRPNAGCRRSAAG